MEVCRVNLRHRTLPLPLVPMLYFEYRANRALALERVPFVRNCWRWITGEDRSKVTRGVTPSSFIVTDCARLIYPAYQSLESLTVDLDDADYPPASIYANGKPMVRNGRIYEASALLGGDVEALDIEISHLRRPVPAPLVVRHQRPGDSRRAAGPTDLARGI